MTAVHAALDELAERLGLTRDDTARGIIRLANNNMVNAIKLVSVNRGHDPRDFTLVAFGGGGAMHACALARELGIEKVVIPNLSGVFSAWGMLLSDLRRDYLQTEIVDMAAPGVMEHISDVFDVLETQASTEYQAEGIEPSRVRFTRHGRLRYQNQEHSTVIELPGGELTPSMTDGILERFHARYEREYTYRLDAPVEFVTYHLVALAGVDELRPEAMPPTQRQAEAAVKGTRLVDYLSEGEHEATVYDGPLVEPGMSLSGPAVIEEAAATIVIPPGMSCRVDEYDNYRIATKSGDDR
jgi:N-methylhydantoinase A